MNMALWNQLSLAKAGTGEIKLGMVALALQARCFPLPVLPDVPALTAGYRAQRDHRRD